MRGERGSGTVWALGVLAVLVVVLVGGLALGGAVLARHRAEAGADLAALAGAQALQAGRDPCAAAAGIGAVNGVTLSCSVVVQDVVVEATAPLPAGLVALGSARAVARAGPQR